VCSSDLDDLSEIGECGVIGRIYGDWVGRQIFLSYPVIFLRNFPLFDHLSSLRNFF
jgi:hypothetical protein